MINLNLSYYDHNLQLLSLTSILYIIKSEYFPLTNRLENDKKKNKTKKNTVMGNMSVF